MQPIRTIALAIGTAILLVTASMAIAQGDRTQPAQRPAQQPAGGQPGKKQQSLPPSAAGRAADGAPWGVQGARLCCAQAGRSAEPTGK